MNQLSTWIIIVPTFAISLIGTSLQRRYSLRRGIIDQPNERSSHTVPTPRSGGVAIAMGTLLGFLALEWYGMLDLDLFLALTGGGSAVATVGYLDDRFKLSAPIRLLVHVGAASWLMYFLGGMPSLSFGGLRVELGWTGNVLGVAAVVWGINLFNFMDGTDGIAASEAIFIAVSAGLLIHADASSAGVVSAATIFAAACAGFLIWNWPPAKIFMGDSGSGFLGFVVSGLALGATRALPEAGAIFLILGGVFLVDATTTLVRRVLRGEPFYRPHRIHAYQCLARKLGSHLRVVLVVMAVNLLWLLPCAILAQHQPRWQLPVLVLALFPLVVLVLLAGAGQRQAGN